MAVRWTIKYKKGDELMPIVAQFKDGQFVTNTASTESLSNAKEKNESGITSDTFLQLLVAEMQNQDPLEPTSNTEWVSQYATFSQVSAVNQIGDQVQSMEAKNLVGEYVILKVTNDKGNTDYVSGQVDYVTYEENKAYLSVNGSLYSIDDLDTVASSEYMEAYNLASDMADVIKKLPNVDVITTSYKEEVFKLKEQADNMTAYQKTFLDQSVFDKIDEYYNKLKPLVDSENE